MSAVSRRRVWKTILLCVSAEARSGCHEPRSAADRAKGWRRRDCQGDTSALRSLALPGFLTVIVCAECLGSAALRGSSQYSKPADGHRSSRRQRHSRCLSYYSPLS